jgi:hypothetical protein
MATTTAAMSNCTRNAAQAMRTRARIGGAGACGFIAMMCAGRVLAGK